MTQSLECKKVKVVTCVASYVTNIVFMAPFVGDIVTVGAHTRFVKISSRFTLI